MPKIPLALLPVPRQRYFVITAAGLQPLQGSMSFFKAGTSTPQEVWSDPQGEVTLGTIVNMFADGYLPAVYIPPFGIKAILTDQVGGAGAQIWAQDMITDPGASYLADYGHIYGEGSKGVASGYTITDDDYFVTVNEPTTDPAIIQLPPSAERGQPITIKNLGPTHVAATPDGTESIDGLPEPYLISDASGAHKPTITLVPLKAGTGYLIRSSH